MRDSVGNSTAVLRCNNANVNQPELPYPLLQTKGSVKFISETFHYLRKNPVRIHPLLLVVNVR